MLLTADVRKLHTVEFAKESVAQTMEFLGHD